MTKNLSKNVSTRLKTYISNFNESYLLEKNFGNIPEIMQDEHVKVFLET